MREDDRLLGHALDPVTRTCVCGITARELADTRRPPSHEDVLHPGTVAATYRQRSTGRVIAYRKPKP